MLGGIKKLLGGGAHLDAAHGLYVSLVAQARSKAFFQPPLSVPDTIDGRFELIALHAFLVMHRLKDAGEGAAEIAQALFDLMFKDLDQGLRDLGSSDIRVAPRVRQMTSAFMGRVEAFGSSIEGASGELEAAIERNLYRGEKQIEDACAILAAYMRREAEALKNQELATLLTGAVQFGAPPVAEN
jgi:cytochrome b pre-mRNA-processing protein 3